jgi:hypothetical protein
MKFLIIVSMIRAVVIIIGNMFTKNDAVIDERNKRKIFHPSEFLTRW